MTDKNNAPAPQRSRRWLKASLGAVAMGVMVASGAAQAAGTCQPDKLYDIITSSFHQSSAQRTDGTWAGWGQAYQSNGRNSALNPVDISAVDGYEFPDGVGPLLITHGSASTSSAQMVALGSDGKFYAWGAAGHVLPTSYKDTTSFGATSLELPNGPDGNPLQASDVEMMTASAHILIIVAKGAAWTLVNEPTTGANSQRGAAMQGSGEDTNQQTWQRVRSSEGPLTGVIAARAQMGTAGIGAAMALAKNTVGGQDEYKLWAWGTNAYNGGGEGQAESNGARQSYNVATEMALPADAVGVPKQIGVTGGHNEGDSGPTSASHRNSYYVLYDRGADGDGKPLGGQLYAVGSNDSRELGTFNTDWSTSWVKIQRTGGENPEYFDNVTMFSVQEHDYGYGGSAGGLIDTDGDLYGWGRNGGKMIGGATTNAAYDPSIYGGLTKGEIHANYVEVGGHTSVYIKDKSTRFCYVGHKTQGSMGDGISTSSNIDSWNCTATPQLNVCGSTGYDYGDAPSVYEAGGGSNLAMHFYVGDEDDLYLGVKGPQANDPSPKSVVIGQPNVGERGDFTLDTDGNPVIEEDALDGVNGGVTNGGEGLTIADDATSFSLNVKVVNNTGNAANLYAWVDWNNNGKFELGEYASATVEGNAGERTVSLNWSGLHLTPGGRYVRLRLTTDNLADGTTTDGVDKRALGLANNGEIEDHLIVVTDSTQLPNTPPVAIDVTSDPVNVVGPRQELFLPGSNGLTPAELDGADNAPGEVVSYTIESLPVDGNLFYYNGSTWVSVTEGMGLEAGARLAYEPTNPNATGPDTFEFIAWDNDVAPSTGYSEECTDRTDVSTCVVQPGNGTYTIPKVKIEARDDSVNGVINQPVTTPVVNNDEAKIYDPSATDTNFTIKTDSWTNGNHGTVNCEPATGQCIYTPESGYIGSDSYTYQICMEAYPWICDMATVTLNISEVAKAPALKLDKMVTSNGPYKAGDTISYSFKVTNIGNVPLTDVNVDDPKLSASAISCDSSTLAVGADTACGPASYTVTTADVAAGQVHNHATASGTPPSGLPVTSADEITTPLPYTPALDVAKVVTSSGPYAVGDTITYAFTATNTGNVPLESVSVNDDMLGGAVACNETTLLPGTSTTCGPVDYLLQSDDINNGQIVNVANATGTPTVEDPGNPGTPPEVTTPPAKVETPVAPAPALSVLKEVVSAGPYEEGDNITYLFTVTNTGNVNMSDVFVTDALIGGEPVLCANTVLTPAQSTTCGPVNYTVTEADVTAGNVHNEATTTGTPPDPNNPSTPGTPVTTPPSKVDTPTGKRPALVLEKRVISSGPYAEGDEISYQFKVTNVGNVKLNSVAVNDPLLDAEVDCAPQVLNPSEAAYCGPKAYTVTANDVIEGEVYNHATATGFTPDDEPVNAEDAVTTPLDYQPDLTLTKVVTSSGPYQVGDTITYSFTATNSGNVTLEGVSVNDPMLGGPVSCAVSTLVPSQSTLCGPVHYTLQPEDIDNGQILNVATATGTPVVEDPDNPGTPPEVTTPPAKVETPVTPVPALSIVKEVISAGPYELGDTITYLFTVTNTGNVALSGVSVDDPLVGGAIACTAGSLAPAQSTTCGPVNYAVTADDVTAGNVLNEATATGTSPADPGDPTVPGTPVTTPPATVDTEIGKKPALMLDKRVISEGPYELGDTVTYQFKVTNTGNVQLSGVAVNDPKLDAAPIACSPAALNPGESSFCGPRDYEVTADDVKLREVLNKATAQATPAGSSDQVESPEAEVTTPIKLPPPVAVPVDNPFALILLALGLLGLGSRYARKRRAA